jgi:UDP-GlcNAc:undecaprenyl-phosphate GlcNAc-1-phosphate transferase
MFNFLLVLVFAVFFGVLWLWLFNKFKILDRPWKDVPPRDSVPTVQGGFLIIWFLVTVATLYPDFFVNPKFLWFLMWAWLLLSVAFIDSFYSIKASWRLLVHFMVWFIVVIWSGLLPDSLSFAWFTMKVPYLISVIFWVIWIVGFINAINRFDGVYGLASWVSTIGFLTIYLLTNFVVVPKYWVDLATHNVLNMVSWISMILFVFWLVYTFIEYKPLWVVRDVGTMFYGLSLAYLSIVWWIKIWMILVVLSLVIFDAVRVFVNRIFVMKKSPTKKDYTHLHYRLLAQDWSRGEIRFFIWWYSLFLMILMILQWDNRLNKFIIFGMMLLIFFWVHIYLYWIKKINSEFVPVYQDSVK